MRRGFKAEAERIATEIRDAMGLGLAAPATSTSIAEHLGVTVRAADELVERGRLEELAQVQADAFSAATFRMPSGKLIVVTNPLNAAGRLNSDLAHELAHLILKHRTRRLETLEGMRFFTCDSEQEEEANWLAGCLLLPRGLLLQAARNGWGAERIARQYTVSVPMARFRLNASGVLIQIGREIGTKTRRTARSS
jgi:Zn-dependent peptidase ImmA (M78 family)